MDNKSKKKKVVVTTTKPKSAAKPTVSKKKLKTTTSKKAKSNKTTETMLVFGKDNYFLMGVGLALVVLGMLLMLGGKMPNTETWDDNIIYSFRRTVLAPITILAGLVVEIFAIFKGYKIQE